MTLRLFSKAFADGGEIPRRFACDGQNLTPPLEWSGAPVGTKAFLLTCDDIDAPEGRRRHWAVCDIPAGSRRLESRRGVGPPAVEATPGVNDFESAGYAGPWPAPEDEAHRFRFRLSALRRAVGAPQGLRCDELAKLARPLEIESAELVGVYGR